MKTCFFFWILALHHLPQLQRLVEALLEATETVREPVRGQARGAQQSLTRVGEVT